MEVIWDGRIRADARALPIADESVQCVVTSPPYWGLRSYGHAGEIGQERTLPEYLDVMRAVFAEVWRVLRPDGTLWLNLGDAYSGSWGSQGFQGHGEMTSRSIVSARKIAHAKRKSMGGSLNRVDGLKAKNLIGLPWRIAFALQEDGWFLRCDIIWNKRNPLPESVKDRPVRSHEYVFLLSKSSRYFYDARSIEEPASPNTHARYARGRRDSDSGTGPKTAPDRSDGVKANRSFQSAIAEVVPTRNKRTVWTMSNLPYPGAHFATYPPQLVEPCILAGSRPGDVVLDPFAGSGTVAMVAERLGRRWIAVDLGYQDLQAERLNGVQRELVGA